MTPTIIDLFSGAGGFTTGFYLVGFKPIFAIDINAKALATYQHNYPKAKTITNDIRTIDAEELRLALHLKKQELTAIIGGPPCQGFSRNVPAGYRYLEDPKNQLYKTYLDFVREFRPLYVVLENVPEILNAYKGAVREEITTQLERLGYGVTSVSLNGANYGIPQTRKRAFFIAALNSDAPTFPKPTHQDEIKSLKKPNCDGIQLNLFEPTIPFFLTVRDAIGDLPALKAGEKYTEKTYPCEPQTDYQRLLRQNSQQLFNHIARDLSTIQMARARALKEGQDATDLPPDLAPKKHYSGAYGRLFWDKPARTITKWVFHPGSGRFLHPVQDRTITIREAARLQSFPDNFLFLGSYIDMAAQIGESVPPLLAKAIAESILQTNRLPQSALI